MEKLKNKTVQLSFEEYEKIGKQVIFFIREKQKEEGDNFEGILQKDLLGTYLKEVENQIKGTDDLMYWAKKLSSVIQRLIVKEGVLCALNDPQSKDDRMLCLNVNIDFDNIQIGS